MNAADIPVLAAEPTQEGETGEEKTRLLASERSLVRGRVFHAAYRLKK